MLVALKSDPFLKSDIDQRYHLDYQPLYHIAREQLGLTPVVPESTLVIPTAQQSSLCTTPKKRILVSGEIFCKIKVPPGSSGKHACLKKEFNILKKQSEVSIPMYKRVVCQLKEAIASNYLEPDIAATLSESRESADNGLPLPMQKRPAACGPNLSNLPGASASRAKKKRKV